MAVVSAAVHVDDAAAAVRKSLQGVGVQTTASAAAHRKSLQGAAVATAVSVGVAARRICVVSAAVQTDVACTGAKSEMTSALLNSAAVAKTSSLVVPGLDQVQF